MADFERKMQMLAGRGKPVGAEDLIERIEAELAGDPLVVVNKQRKGSLMAIETDKRQDQKSPGVGKGLIWAAAAFVGVLAVGVATLLVNSDGELVAAPPEVAVVHDMYESINDHDPEYAASFADISTAVEFHPWMTWFFGLNVEGTYECVLGEAAGEVVCQTVFHNDLARLAGLDAVEDGQIFVVESGRIVSTASDDSPFINEQLPSLVIPFTAWIRENRPDVWAISFSVGCNPEGRGCVNLSEPTWMSTRENGAVLVELASEFFATTSAWPREG